MDDAFGYAITVDDADALNAFDRTRHGVLSHGADTLDNLNAALAADPEFTQAHALKGLLMMTLARRELVTQARTSLETAKVCLTERGGTPRETAYIQALEHWLSGDAHVASTLLDGVLKTYPRDTLTMKLVQAIRFMSGDQRGMRASVEDVLKAIGPDHPELGYVMGCHAFSLEETGDYARAEAVGRRGVALAPDDAWGMHAVAHVHEMNCRPEDGIAWINSHRDNFAHCNNFRFHIYWHLALFHLERKEYDKVLDLYDENVNAEGSDDYRDISNSASLLARLNLEGVNCEKRWQALAEQAAHRLDDGCLGFADLHYLIAMAGAGRLSDADKLGDRIAAHGASTPCETARTAAKVACGLKAFAHGDYAEAFEGLAGGVPALVSIGGSHAQRDVFVRLAVESGIRAGAFDGTTAILEGRRQKRHAVDAFENERLAVIHSQLKRDRGHATAVQIGNAALATTD